MLAYIESLERRIVKLEQRIVNLERRFNRAPLDVTARTGGHPRNKRAAPSRAAGAGCSATDLPFPDQRGECRPTIGRRWSGLLGQFPRCRPIHQPRRPLRRPPRRQPRPAASMRNSLRFPRCANHCRRRPRMSGLPKNGSRLPRARRASGGQATARSHQLERASFDVVRFCAPTGAKHKQCNIKTAPARNPPSSTNPKRERGMPNPTRARSVHESTSEKPLSTDKLGFVSTLSSSWLA